MTKLALLSIILGIVMIALRGPLIFAPRAVMDSFRTLIASKTRVRVMGVIVVTFGLIMIVIPWGSEQAVALAIIIPGFMIAIVGTLLLLIFPSTYQVVAEFVFDLDPKLHRGLGVLGVVFGIVFIILGLKVF